MQHAYIRYLHTTHPKRNVVCQEECARPKSPVGDHHAAARILGIEGNGSVGTQHQLNGNKGAAKFDIRGDKLGGQDVNDEVRMKVLPSVTGRAPGGA